MNKSAKTIILDSPQALEAAQRMIPHLPIDGTLQLAIQPAAKTRSTDQNAYYWLRVGEIAEQAFLNGRQFNSEVWHAYFRRNVLPDIVTLKSGEKDSKWLEVPDGTLIVRSTTELEKKCFADYTTAVEAFGANLGVMFSADPRQARRAQ